jgi:hypothetical protein
VTAVLLLVTAALPAFAQWQPDGKPVCVAAGEQFMVAMASDGAGGVLLTWIDERLEPANDDVYVQRLTADGRVASGWAANGVAVCTLPKEQIVGDIVGDGTGGALVVWDDGRRFKDHDVYAGRILDTGVVDPRWPENGVRLQPPILAVKSGPLMVADGAGGAFVAWNDYSTRPTGGDIFAQHLRADGTTDPAWPDSGMVICRAPGNQMARVAIPDGSGGFFVVWEDLRQPAMFRGIYAQQVLPSGVHADGWPENGLGVSTGEALRDHPAAVSDGAGGLIVAWRDYRDYLSGDIYALRINGEDGVADGWHPNGTLVAGGPEAQWDPSLAADGDGGVIIAYWAFSESDPGNTDIYATRLTSRGSVTVGWPAAGRLLCGAPGRQDGPRAVPDGSGGAIVAWADARGGSPSVYGVRILGTGLLANGWTGGGKALIQSGDMTGGPTMLADAGGAFLAWTDNRSGDSDIYVQRVNGDGTVAPGYGPPSISQLTAYPNPARREVTILLGVSSPEPVTARVFDLAGRLIRTLGPGPVRDFGTVPFSWNTRDEKGRRVPGGAYFVRVDDSPQGNRTRIVVIPQK